jgi:hypothetical protein
MNRANLWSASLLMVALTTVACGQDQASPFSAEQKSTLASRKAAVASLPKALILESTVVGGKGSVEAQAAEALGLEPEVVSNEEWAGMSSERFSEYQVIILGDANCASLDAASAAVANRWVWGSVVNGNVLIAGTAPVANGAPAIVTQKAISFAAAEFSLTGLYLSLSCYYQNAAPGTQAQILEPFGQFSVQSGACHSNAHIVGRHPELNALHDSTMSNWPCSVGTQFESFPAGDFVPWSVAMYQGGSRSSSPGIREFVDGSFGAPYILARGASLLGCGNYEQEVGEECDFGREANGNPDSGCSATCHMAWCGDGIVNGDEDCDEGYMNGYGACPRSCRIGRTPPPPPTNRPPVARCRPVALSAGPSCGGVGASINDGSSDPDGDLVGCVQSVTSFELGSTVATLTCTDSQGLSASCTAPVNVMDDSAPTISCPAPSSFECGGATAQVAPAQAQDNCSSPIMSHRMSGDSFTLGVPRTVTWTAYDGVASATCSTTMTMVDTLAPSLSLRGDAQQRLECGVGSYSEAGVLASDACAGDLSSRVTVSGQVNAAAVGNYTVNYSVADGAGHSASASRTVSVTDTLAPSISLVGAPSMRLECAVDSFVNPGATAVDACSGNLTSAITTSGSVNTGAVGSYAVNYRVADGAGLSATAVRTVQVADTKAPSLTLKGASAMTLECGVGSYNEAGASAADACTGDLSSKVAISGTVNAAARGTYTKSYSVADASGNVASAVRTVSVTDTLAPSIALVGAPLMRLECGVDSFVNPGATAVDACSGNLTPAIATSGSVNTGAVGNYAVNYRVADGAGLSATAVRTVQVADTRAPSLTLNGASSMTLECGMGSYNEAGATAADACMGNLTSSIVTSGTVNTAARGTYTKSYSVADASGNVASASRTVSVTDTRAPSISLVGSENMRVRRGGTFTDPGATATDACSGNLTSAIVRSGSVNTAVTGTYSLRYSVADAVGLSAAATRTVTVASPCTPTVTVRPVQQIWPPNHSYQSFTLASCAAVTTTCENTCDTGGGDDCQGSETQGDINAMGTILSIYSDEVEDAQGNGDGNTRNDIVITGPSSFKLRVERQGKGNGRFYGVNFKVTDSDGNVQVATCKFMVPHDQSGRGAVDNGAAAGYTVHASSLQALSKR